MTRTLRHFAAWLAFIGIAFAAVWPTLATAQPKDEHRKMVPCPHTGLLMLDTSGASDEDTAPGRDTPGTAQPGKAQCALCASGAGHALPSVCVPGIAPVSADAVWLRAEPSLPALPRNVCLIPPAQAPPQLS